MPILPLLLALQVAATPVAQSPLPPTLVVLITVDQLRPDYFDRFKGQLTGGLGRLYRGGAVFTNAHQDHAMTETAPGHASTLSGRFPRSTGIVQNDAGVGDAQSPLIERGVGPGASPYRFRGTVLIDWMRLRDARSRALSVSRKDRGAILPLGRAKQSVFWWSLDARFVTSTYYADSLPSWVRAFNARRTAQNMAGRAWTPLLADSAYSEPDSVPQEADGKNIAFPHVMPADTAAAKLAFGNFPWMDDATIALALDGVQATGIGSSASHVDLLAVSLSSTDIIGHAYGPDSRELHDQIVRLDRVLGVFLDSLFRLRDSTRIVIALTSDHGVQPIPGVRSHDPTPGGRRVVLDTLLRATRAALASRGVDSAAFLFDDGVLMLNRAVFERAKVNADSLVRDFAAAVRRVPGVLRTDTYAGLQRADTVRDRLALRWLRMFPDDRRPALVVTLRPYNIWYPRGASHGSPHDLDTHVPIILYGASYIEPGTYRARAAVVDLGPTLAAIAGVVPVERVDGKVLRAALRTPPGVPRRAARPRRSSP